MKKVLPFLIAALMIPGVALAKGPNPNKGTHANHGHQPKVMYVLKGLLYNYQAYTPAEGTNSAVPGSVDIVVLHSNRHGKLLRSDPNNNPVYVTITIGPKTKLRLKNGVTSITDGDRGAIRVRASKLAFKSATQKDVLGALANQPAHMVTDWGQPSPS
jgi:hypothetical protein